MTIKSETPIKKKGRYKDISGKTFKYLKVINYDHTHNGNAYWNCKCLGCGKQVTVRSDNIIGGNTQSCGCLRKKRNHIFVLENRNAIIVFYNKSNGFFVADLADLSLVETYPWHPSSREEPVTSLNGRDVSFARLKLGIVDSDLQVDHTNHDPRDNRSCNIRACTKLQNLVNRKQAIGTISEENGLFILSFPAESGEDKVFTFKTKAEAKAYKVQYLNENYFEFTPWNSAEIAKEHRLHYLDKVIGLHAIGSYDSILEEMKQLPERNIFKIILRDIYSMTKDCHDGKSQYLEENLFMLLLKLLDEYRVFKAESA